MTLKKKLKKKNKNKKADTGKRNESETNIMNTLSHISTKQRPH